ncbi:MAG: hypothetical protein ABIJ37_09440 [Pseudomonadota bacterium]
MSSKTYKVCFILSMTAVIFSLSSCITLGKAQTPHVKYTVTAQSVTISSAVTHYDFDTKARQAFLSWFKRGFETVLAGKPPMMITWRETTEGEAGRKGYELGMDEGEKYLKNPVAFKSLQIIQIPPD